MELGALAKLKRQLRHGSNWPFDAINAFAQGMDATLCALEVKRVKFKRSTATLQRRSLRQNIVLRSLFLLGSDLS